MKRIIIVGAIFLIYVISQAGTSTPPGFKCSNFIPSQDLTRTNVAITKIDIPAKAAEKNATKLNDTEWLNNILNKSQSTETKVSPPAYAIATSDFTITVYDELASPLFSLKGHNGRINQLISIPATEKHGPLLASCSDDQSVIVYDLTFKNQRLKFTGHTAAVKTLAYIDTYKFMASGSEDGQVLFWDLDKGAIEGRVKDIQEFAPYSLAHIKGTENLIIGTGLNIKFFHMRKYPGIIKLANLGRNGRVDSLAYIEDTDYVAAASSNIGIVSFFNHQDKAEMPTSFKDIESGGVAPGGLLYVPEHKIIAAVGKARSGKAQHSLKIWKLRVNKNYAPFFMAYNYASFTNFDKQTPSGQAIYLDGLKKLVLLMEYGVMTYNLTHLPLLSYHGDCYAPCPVETFPMKTQCLSCASSCLTCTGPRANQCSFCKNEMKFFHNNCLGSCPINTLYLPQNQTCICKENFVFDGKVGVCVERNVPVTKQSEDYNLNHSYVVLIIIPILAVAVVGAVIYIFCKKGAERKPQGFGHFKNEKERNPGIAAPQIKVGTPEPKETVFSNPDEEEVVQQQRRLLQKPGKNIEPTNQFKPEPNAGSFSPGQNMESVLKPEEGEKKPEELLSPKVLVTRSGAIMMDMDRSFGFEKKGPRKGGNNDEGN